MLKDILELLQAENYYGESEYIEIAKGKYKYPESFKEAVEQFKRSTKWQ
jgi:hypothetical protein